MKVLVDKNTDVIVGTYTPPLNFSIGEYYVIDLPDSLSMSPTSSSASTFITAKVAAFKAKYTFSTQSFNDEFLTTAGIDPALSDLVEYGPKKRVLIQPGGTLMTTGFTITVPTLEKVVIHWSGYQTYMDPGAVVSKPSPKRILYDYDPGLPGFFTFDPNTFDVSMMNSTGLVTLIGVGELDKEVTYLNGTPLTVRLKFVNSGSTPAYLSDWIFLA